jgi:Mg2+/Co2+ transporter CorB
MSEPSTSTLLIILFILVILSGFFSGSETSITSLNRHKLQHNAKKKNKNAMLLMSLLHNPDKILSAILIGNTLSNILASSITTIIALRFGGEIIAISAPFMLTLIILIFSEIAPKTVATFYPEKIAYPASKILVIALKVLFPIVFLTNSMSKLLLKCCKIKTEKSVFSPLTQEELRGILSNQDKTTEPEFESDMLVGVLNLDQVTVNGVMIPRNEIAGLDIDSSWSQLMTSLKTCKRKQIIVYRSIIDDALGVLDLTTAISLMEKGMLNKNTIIRNLKEIKYIPEGTSLKKQLKNFQKYSFDLGLIVDEYGDILGLIQIEDIIEEITGKLYQNTDKKEKIEKQDDESYIIPGNFAVRDLNRELDWDLPIDGPTTLSGMIIEHLETIPEGKVCCLINSYPMEVLSYQDNKILKVQIFKRRVQDTPSESE